MQKQGIKSPCDNKSLPGGLGAKTFVNYAKGYGANITFEESKHLCALWKRMFPEMEQHLTPTPMVGVADRFEATTLTGRLRKYCSFCAAANTLFQGFAADISKEAGWALVREGYCTVNFVHDEIITLIPWNEHCTSRALHMQQIMVDIMQAMTPDVTCKAETALMFRWTSQAEPWFDGEGDLIPFEMIPTYEDNGRTRMYDWEGLSSKQQQTLLDEKHRAWEKNKELG